MPLPPGRGATMLRRGRTLIRPERMQQNEPMIQKKHKRKLTPWVIYSRIITFWAPSILLTKLGGMSNPSVQQAWREKIALVSIITFICAIVVFLTLFLPMVFCRGSQRHQGNVHEYNATSLNSGVLGYQGRVINFDKSQPSNLLQVFANRSEGEDITMYFRRSLPESCRHSNGDAATRMDPCDPDNGVGGCHFDDAPVVFSDKYIGYDWGKFPLGYAVLNGTVLNFTPYLNYAGDKYRDQLTDKAIRVAIDEGRYDITIPFYSNPELKKNVNCIFETYSTGVLVKDTPGCFGVNLYNYFALVVIIGIVLIRFFMALIFQYFLSWQLVRRPSRDKVSPLSYNANAPWSGKAPVTGGAKVKLAGGDADELYTALLVTCYSEGEESMRGTCDSLAATEYSDSRKLLFIIADGIIKGSGNDRTTPDICVDLIEQDPQFADPLPCSYIAVADGSKQHNMAKVYCGHYVHATHRVPAVIVVKCGAPEEADLPKPGNRGKRDSQMILMNFFSRAIYNDRMTPLDYDLFRKIHHLMGVTPDMFEIVLMVDADTKVYPDSLRLLVNCMNNDQLIMGICGETKIANKRDSWVTAIQVFEYYISHHLSKAFESVFGGVTCLPGCFCMYRLKARKGSDWVPILTKPEVCQEYSQNIVETLHEKNLLLLGEDRFLSTLMLRTFPKRKMMFMPQAICKTLVPDSFKVLLSQRRRWINSTVHNLMELVLVKDLCGTFCLSMQFSVMLDLIGTVALPVAIVLTYILIIRAAMSTYDSVTDFVPLAMLLIVLFLPGVLILFTTRKWIYVGWMFIYLIALPVWNMILPVYAYWHFDDFSWGETRKVQGEGKGDGHGASDGVFDSTKVPMRRWEDYERRRLRSIRRKKREADEKRIDNASSVADGSVVTTGDQIGGLSTQDSGTATPTYYYEERPAYDYLESHGAGMNSPHTNQHFDAGNQYPIHPQLTDGTAGSSTAFASQYQNAQYSTPGGGGYYDDGYDSPAYGGQYGYEGGYPQNHYNGSGGLAPPVPAMTRDDYGGEGYYQGQQGQQGHQARPAGPRPPQ